MHDLWLRFMENFSLRLSGPMKLRFVMQPLMALIFATIAGLKDAKAGKPPYFWSFFWEPQHRLAQLKDGWKSVGKVFVAAIILDVVFEIKVLGTVYPGEAVIVAFLLAIVPYLMVRGLVNRFASKRSTADETLCARHVTRKS
jgi:hypothetical protein